MVVDDIPIYKLPLEKLADFRREYLGFIFQSFQLIPYLTVIENVMLPLSITEKSNQEQVKMAEEILERIGLKGKGEETSGSTLRRGAGEGGHCQGPGEFTADSSGR